MDMCIHGDNLRIFVQGIPQTVLPPTLRQSQLAHFRVMENDEDGTIWILIHQSSQLLIQPIFRIVVAVIGIVIIIGAFPHSVIHIVGQGYNGNTVNRRQMRTITPISYRYNAAVGTKILCDQGIELIFFHIEVVSVTVVDIVGTAQRQQDLGLVLYVITDTGQKELPFIFRNVTGRIFVTIDAIAVKYEGIDCASLRLGIGIGGLENLRKAINRGRGRYRICMNIGYHNKP